MKQSLRQLLIALLCVALPSGAGVARERVRNVLVLNSYHPDFDWSKRIMGGVEAGFANAAPGVLLHPEYLDTKRYQSPEYMALLTRMMRLKLANKSFDLLIVSDNNALTFALANRDLFPAVPIVFCGINNFTEELVGRILAFSRQTEQAIGAIRPQAVLGEVVKLVRSSIPRTIEIAADIDMQCRMILADAGQLHQIAMNLITNAYHAMERQEGGTLGVRLHNRIINADAARRLGMDAGNYVCLAISDTGVGMDGQTLERIFDPYFTTKPKGKGTGLGLSVVHGIVKGFGGKMTVHSAVGEGSLFEICFPGIDGTEPVEPEAVCSTGVSGCGRVLLVDDEEAVLRLMREMLERMGYRVDTCIGSLEALEKFRADAGAYDVVITDMTMPRMSGDNLSKELIRIRPDIPIIMCTGYSDKISVKRAEEIGIRALTHKPIIRNDLVRLLQSVTGEERAS